jgi:hypothetical protein
MVFRGLTMVLAAGLGCCLVAAACSAPDPGAITFGQRAGLQGDGGSSGGGSSSGGSSTSSSSSSSSGGADGGGSSSGGLDAGQDTGPATPLAFVGAPPYTQTVAPTINQGQHNTANGAPPNSNCFSCHTKGGSGIEFVFGGRVRSAANGGTPVAGAEVRVVTNGQAMSVYTDQNGYYYAGGTALNQTSNVGVRTANAIVGMTDSLSAGGCSAGGCHDGTAQPPVHVP